MRKAFLRPVTLMVECRSPKPNVASSSLAWPVSYNYQELIMKKIVQFCKESIAELKKVVWPSKDDVVQSTKVVLMSTVVIAIILGLMDFLFTKGMTAIF